jgi:uncharacterized protein YjbJ (UPF0337 family)
MARVQNRFHEITARESWLRFGPSSPPVQTLFTDAGTETCMSKLREKTQGQTKQIVGQIVGDDELIREGVEQQHQAEQEHKPEDDRGEHAPRRD